MKSSIIVRFGLVAVLSVMIAIFVFAFINGILVQEKPDTLIAENGWVVFVSRGHYSYLMPETVCVEKLTNGRILFGSGGLLFESKNITLKMIEDVVAQAKNQSKGKS